jgi:hypothetical protein
MLPYAKSSDFWVCTVSPYNGYCDVMIAKAHVATGFIPLGRFKRQAFVALTLPCPRQG